MNLTSLQRTKNALGLTSSDDDGLLQRLIASTSARFAYYLRRQDSLELKTRTVFFSPEPGQRSFVLLAYPVASIATIKYDESGRFEGDETTLAVTDFRLVNYGGVSRKILVNSDVLLPYEPDSVRVEYTGGLAPSATSSTWTKTGGSLTAGKFVQGQTSLAAGRILATSANSITYDCIFGIFEAGETLKEFDTLDNKLQGGGFSGATNQTSTLGVRQTGSVAESYPDICEACEMEIRFMRTNRTNFENITVSLDDMTKVSRGDLRRDYTFLPEVRDILDTHMNKDWI